MEVALLAALQHREAHERFAHFVKPQALTADAFAILTALGEWWQQQPATESTLDVGAFTAWYVLVRHAKADKDKVAVHRALIERMAEWEGGDEIGPLLQGLMRRDYAGRIADVALRIADGDYNLQLEAIEDTLEQYKREARGADRLHDKLGSFSVEALESVAGPGLNWRLKNLMETAGPIRQGDLIVFAKRPDAGGTTFLASETTYMGQQLEGDDQILWLNNEEAGNKVRRRIVQSALGWTTEEMNERGMKEALREYVSIMGLQDRIVVYDDSKVSIKQAERVIEEVQPKLIVFDQLWKVKGLPNTDGVEALTFAFNWAREVAKEYAPLIAVHQMGAEGDKVRYPGYDTLYGTKTGGPGEADLIIMMSRPADAGLTRYFWAPKNKMLTPGDETLRNKRWEALIEPTRARFKET